MKDIPVFTGQHGVASLMLKQIPWSGCAYVLVRSIWDDAERFLEECKGFCRACGAQAVYASWEQGELPAPHAYDMLVLERTKEGLPKSSLQTELLGEENGDAFLEIYNTCFRQVPHAALYTRQDILRLTEEESGILVRQDGVPAAMAQVSRQGLEAIAVLPQYKGLGYELALAAMDMVPSKTITIKVVSVNERALRLYERLGFRRGGVLSRWWKIW